MRYDREGLIRLLREAREAGATDLHLKAPGRPRFRVLGDLIQTPYPSLRPDDAQRLAQAILDLAKREVPLAGVTDLRIGFGLHREGRFRAHIYRQRGSLGLVVHRMALEPPSLVDLDAAPSLVDDVWGGAGLFLVTGRRDRLRLLAGLIDGYNQRFPGCLFTIEDPLEFLHKDARAVIAQREVGVDVLSVAEGLEGALRADCDGLVATDLPDPESAELALRMAEDGRPVVVGLAGCPWEEAGRVLLRRFPARREAEIRDRLERCLKGVVYVDGARATLAPAPALAG